MRRRRCCRTFAAPTWAALKFTPRACIYNSLTHCPVHAQTPLLQDFCRTNLGATSSSVCAVPGYREAFAGVGGGCQAVTQVDQCSLEQYYLRSSMLRALIYNQARSPGPRLQARAPWASCCAKQCLRMHSIPCRQAAALPAPLVGSFLSHPVTHFVYLNWHARLCNSCLPACPCYAPTTSGQTLSQGMACPGTRDNPRHAHGLMRVHVMRRCLSAGRRWYLWCATSAGR